VTPENFDDFHNHPKKINDRERMLKGLWPEESMPRGPERQFDKLINSNPDVGCTYCKDIEDRGGMSDRQYQIAELERRGINPDTIVPKELFDDPTATRVNPTILEVYFNNVCNMACLYCGPHFSSMWEEEHKRFKAREDGILVNPMWRSDNAGNKQDQLVEKFFDWMERNGHSLVSLNLLGGEPFFQKEFDRMLEHFDRFPAPKLTLMINTNLKVLHKKLVGYIEQLTRMRDEGKIKSVQFNCSMDGWGKQMEYQRWGLDLKDWQENFEYLVKQEWLILNFNAAITSLTLPTFPDLLVKMKEWNTQRRDHICYSFMFVVTPPQLDPCVFGWDVFGADMQRVLDELPKDNEWQRSANAHMEGLAMSLKNSQRDPVNVKKLYLYLEEMDRRRGTRWQEYFPWLIPEFAEFTANANETTS
jgi:hypothetical protein